MPGFDGLVLGAALSSRRRPWSLLVVSFHQGAVARRFATTTSRDCPRCRDMNPLDALFCGTCGELLVPTRAVKEALERGEQVPLDRPDVVDTIRRKVALRSIFDSHQRQAELEREQGEISSELQAGEPVRTTPP
jgi:hypothetical protein